MKNKNILLLLLSLFLMLFATTSVFGKEESSPVPVCYNKNTGIEYYYLVDAIDSAKDGEVIVLIDDADLDEPLNIRSGITLDGGDGDYYIYLYSEDAVINLYGNAKLKNVNLYVEESSPYVINAFEATDAEVNNVEIEVDEENSSTEAGIAFKCNSLDVVSTSNYSYIGNRGTSIFEEACNPKNNPSSSTSSVVNACSNPKDKNCDGVVTCEEDRGLGWTWNNTTKACEYTGDSDYKIVNTSAK